MVAADGAGAAGAPYWVARVSVGPEATDAVSNFLAEAGATGVIEESDSGGVLLRAFFPPGTDPAGLAERVDAYLDALQALSVLERPGSVEVGPVREEPWGEAWRAFFRPVAIGRRLYVCPPWEAPAATPAGPGGARIPVFIEPGLAFGTGGHVTTRACLELLERACDLRLPTRMLDVGTGSGILAIAAARLGARAVTALDVDPDAVAAATANAARNGLEDVIRVELGTLETWAGAPVELAVANLLGSTLVILAPTLGRSVAAAGRLIVGGLLVHQVPVVVASLVPEGFQLVELVEHEGWAALTLARGG